MRILPMFLIAMILLASGSRAQVAINTDNSAPAPSSMLDVQSSDKGFLLPRMTRAQRNAIPSPTEGLMVYCLN